MHKTVNLDNNLKFVLLSKTTKCDRNILSYEGPTIIIEEFCAREAYMTFLPQNRNCSK